MIVVFRSWKAEAGDYSAGAFAESLAWRLPLVHCFQTLIDYSFPKVPLFVL